jgi:poly(beta-D-mannuronate) C5 epimerase
MQRQYIDEDPQADEKQSGHAGRKVLFVLACIVLVWLGYVYYMKVAQPHKDRLAFKITSDNTPLPEKPFLPDISGFTVGMIASKVPPLSPGRIEQGKLKEYPEFRKFLEGDTPRRLRLIQRTITPRGLVVQQGHYDWDSFYREVQAIDPEGKLISKEGNIYTLRVPLLVYGGASLTISSPQVEVLRLSKQANAFLLNAGDFFILRTKIVGWNEEKNAPTKYSGDKKEYRPFITTWSGGNLYIAGSVIESLGYLKGKSYGLSYSNCTPCLKITPDLPRPTGVVVGNQFIDMYYGFYSYEADDVAIIGNTYIDNIVYGIDPHDRSNRLIIAGNEAYGTKEKHGIIVSREVNDGWIFNNYSHHNKGSGFMIDRTSVNNVIANNVSVYNGQDGLTLFESEDNIIWGNRIHNNKRSGIRIRNSWNIKMYNDDIAGNEGASIEVYAADITGQKTRDFELDPYTQKADLHIEGAKIQAKGVAVFKMNGADKMTFKNLDVRTATHLFPSSYVYDNKALRAALGRKNALLEVTVKHSP